MTYVSVRMTSSFVILDCIFQLMLWGHGAQRRAPQTYAPDHGTQFRVPPGPFLQIWPLVASCFRLSVILLCRAFVDLPKFPNIFPISKSSGVPKHTERCVGKRPGEEGLYHYGPRVQHLGTQPMFPPTSFPWVFFLLTLRTENSQLLIMSNVTATCSISLFLLKTFIEWNTRLMGRRPK